MGKPTGFMEFDRLDKKRNRTKRKNQELQRFSYSI